MTVKKVFEMGGGGRITGSDWSAVLAPKAVSSDGTTISKGLSSLFEEIYFEGRRGFSFSQFTPKDYAMQHGLKYEQSALVEAKRLGLIPPPYRIYKDEGRDYKDQVIKSKKYHNFSCMPDVYDEKSGTLISIKCPVNPIVFHRQFMRLDEGYIKQLQIESVVTGATNCYVLIYFRVNDYFIESPTTFHDDEHIIFRKVDLGDMDKVEERIATVNELYDQYADNMDNKMSNNKQAIIE